MTASDVFVGALLVATAGAGAVVRHLVADRLNRDLPIGTLVVNLLAAAGLGVVASGPAELVTVAGIGALGALSTWSTVANEAAIMSREGHGSLGLAYLALTVSSGVLMAWFGLRVGAAIF